MKKIVIDTNALINFPDLLDLEGEIIIPHIVLHELDKLKVGSTDTSYRARQAIRKLKSKIDVIYDGEFTKSHPLAIMGSNDDVILECVKTHEAALITGDFLMQLKAKAIGVTVLDAEEINISDDEYKGYLELSLSDEQLACYYEGNPLETDNLHLNQYVIIKDSSKRVVDALKWDGKSLKSVKVKGFNTDMFGKFGAFDKYQECALDSLQSNQMTMIKGIAGTGKSLISLNYAWSQIEKMKYEKLIIFTNPAPAKNSVRLGFYPGSRLEKILETATGAMLISKFGDAHEIVKQVNLGKIDIMPFSDIRGFDSTGMKAIHWFVEAQNLDIELMRTGIERCGSDSKIILDGDYSRQVDMDAFAGSSNGMRRVSEVYRDRDFYGEVELPIVYRSKMAEIASLL